MSTAASGETLHHHLAVARMTDRRMLHIARLLSFEHKTAPSGELQVVHEREDVGRLTSEYLGRFSGALLLRVTAHLPGPENLGCWNEFELGYGRNGGIPKLTETTRPEDFVACPVGIHEFGEKLRLLHHDFVHTYVSAQNQQTNVTSLIDRIQI